MAAQVVKKTFIVDVFVDPQAWATEYGMLPEEAVADALLHIPEVLYQSLSNHMSWGCVQDVEVMQAS